MRNEGTRTYYSIAGERFDGDLKSFLAYVERLCSTPPDILKTASACAVAPSRAKTRNTS
jgi:hypothetical protein